MSPYNAYSSSLSSSRVSSYTPSSKYSGSTSYSSLSSSSYNYKPPTYSSSLSSKYRPPSTYSYSSPSTYGSSTLPRNYSSSYLNRVPKFTSVSSYTNAITSSNGTSSSDYKWRSTTDSTATDSARVYRSPSLSLSRRNSSVSLSSHTSDRSPRPSLTNYTSTTDNTPIPYKSSSSWSQSLHDDDDEKVGVRVGLNNLGNTCFMNAVLQCLCHTQPLVDYCVKGTYLNDMNHRSPTRGDLMRVFAEFVKKIGESKAKSAISPYHLRREVQRYAPRFMGDNQQDAQEFLRYLLQGLHDDINRVKFRRNSYVRRDSYGGDALGSWKRYKDTDDSLIVDLFAGQLKSTLRCTVCNNDSITYDPFWDLSLPIPEGSRNASLRQCFNLFSSPEILDGPNEPFCERCKKKSRSSKKMEVNKFPKILVIHLKRFSATCYGQKLNMMVDCPTTLSNISEFASQNCLSDGCSYSLYGVVDHDGSNHSGHYTAKCRNPETKEWCEFNDTRVTKASTTNIVTYKTYILFYIQDGSLRY